RGTGDVDARADLYALGCVFYELVCGRPPFLVDGSGEMIAHHLYFEPQPPRSYEPSCPEQVERLILWLLRKQPAARPQTGRELVRALDRPGPAPRARPATAPPARLAPDESPPLVAPSTPLSAAAGITAPIPTAPRPATPRRWLIPAVAMVTAAAGIAIVV